MQHLDILFKKRSAMTLAEMGFRLESGMPEWFTPMRALEFIVFAIIMLWP